MANKITYKPNSANGRSFLIKKAIFLMTKFNLIAKLNKSYFTKLHLSSSMLLAVSQKIISYFLIFSHLITVSSLN